jgi:hypothetical protein
MLSRISSVAMAVVTPGVVVFATDLVDNVGVQVVDDWITSVSACPP